MEGLLPEFTPPSCSFSAEMFSQMAQNREAEAVSNQTSSPAPTPKMSPQIREEAQDTSNTQPEANNVRQTSGSIVPRKKRKRCEKRSSRSRNETSLEESAVTREQDDDPTSADPNDGTVELSSTQFPVADTNETASSEQESQVVSREGDKESSSSERNPPRKRRKTESKTVLERNKMTTSELIVFNRHKRFLRENPEIADVVVSIIEQKYPSSLRVTNYSRKYNLVLGENKDFYVRDEYKKNLPKTTIDPCRRGPRVYIEHQGRMVETTLPQLKCVIWVATTPILNFAKQHYEEIRKDLNIDKGLVTKKKDTSHITVRTQRSSYAMQYLPGSQEF